MGCIESGGCATPKERRYFDKRKTTKENTKRLRKKTTKRDNSMIVLKHWQRQTKTRLYPEIIEITLNFTIWCEFHYGKGKESASKYVSISEDGQTANTKVVVIMPQFYSAMNLRKESWRMSNIL